MAASEIKDQIEGIRTRIETEAVVSEHHKEGEDGFSFRPQRGNAPRRSQITPPRAPKPHAKRWRMDNSKRYSNRGHIPYQETNFPLLEFTDHIQAQLEVKEHFNKKFTFTSVGEGKLQWKLPPAETMYTKPLWEDKDLQRIKVTLNEAKQQLHDKDIESWHKHTNNTNPAQKICYSVRKRAQPEMVTQAWLKFYEIVNAYPIVPEDAEGSVDADPFLSASESPSQPDEDLIPFNSVHLCEAPGAFILALSHYLALNRSTLNWQWIGNTLNPYYEGTSMNQCVVEDRFIYLSLKNWSFGKDNTGDLMLKSNLQDIAERSRHLGTIHLVTADGSIDCQANPSEQEMTTHCLHLCEVVAAMSVLAPGGSIVVKKFTFFESETVNLIYLLCCIFQTVHVFKPGTSKQGNSEVYIIGLGYYGKSTFSEHYNKLLEVYGSKIFSKSMFAYEDLPEEFLQQIRQCAENFKTYQVNTIMRNLMLFQRMPEREKQYNELIKVKANAFFFERNYCTYIPKWKLLTEGNVNKERYLLENDWNKTASALLIRTTCLKAKVGILSDFLKNYNQVYPLRCTNEDEENYASSSFVSPDLEMIKFDTIRGKAFTNIESSKFCSQRVMRIYSDLCHIWSGMEKSNERGDDSPSLLPTLLQKYQGAQVLQSDEMLVPLSGVWALEEAVVLLEEGRVPQGGSLVFADLTLLSRLQYGLLVVLGSSFERVVVYTGLEVGSVSPVLVLEGLKSVGLGEAVVRALHRVGWSPSGGGGGAQGLLQIVSFPMLLQKDLLSVVFNHNTHLCIYRSQVILKKVMAHLG